MRSDEASIVEQLRDIIAPRMYYENEGSDGIPYGDRFVSERIESVRCTVRVALVRANALNSIPVELRFTVSREEELRGGRERLVSADYVAVLDRVRRRSDGYRLYDIIYTIRKG